MEDRFLSSVNRYFQSVRAEHREEKTGNTVLQGKVDSCSFHPDSNHFSCPESFLTCPITLDTPETGVFMRTPEVLLYVVCMIRMRCCNLLKQVELIL